MQQISIDEFFTWQTERQISLRKPIKIVEVVVEQDRARLFADGELELILDRDPELDTHYRVSEIENCFIDQLVFAGTVEDRLTDNTNWVRKVNVIVND